VNIRDTIIDMLEVKVICVYEGFSGKRMAPVLIRELERRAALDGL
jgi:hypothetical protein